MESFLDLINPATYLGDGKYKLLWIRLFETSLNGIFSYFLFYLFLTMAFVAWYRKINIRVSLVLLAVATFIIFGEGLVRGLRFLF